METYEGMEINEEPQMSKKTSLKKLLNEKIAKAGPDLFVPSTNGEVQLNPAEVPDIDGKAPFDMILEFMSSLMTKQYAEALRIGKLVLKYEPANDTVREFLPILDEMGSLLSDSDTSDSSDDPDGSSSESESEDTQYTNSDEEEESASESESGSENSSESDSDSGSEDSSSDSSVMSEIAEEPEFGSGLGNLPISHGEPVDPEQMDMMMKMMDKMNLGFK